MMNNGWVFVNDDCLFQNYKTKWLLVEKNQYVYSIYKKIMYLKSTKNKNK